MFEHIVVIICLLIFAVIIFIPALIIGSVGADRLRNIYEQQSVYTNTTCLVANVTEETLSYDCNCDGCHPSKCYAEHFAVQYQIQNGTKISSIIHVDEIPHLLNVQVNNNYTCYYDRTSVASVQWLWPNRRPALAMLVVGFTVCGLVLLTIFTGLVFWLIKQKFFSKNPHAQF